MASTVRHPEYNEHSYYDFTDNDFTMDNDVMLVFLENPTDSTIGFVKVNSDESTPEIGTPVRVSGWGDTAEFSFSKNVLMAVELNSISNTECSASEGYLG